MNYMRFEKLLGEHVSVLKEAIGNDFENKLFGKNVYYIKDDLIIKDFFGVPYNHINITTNEKGIVESITLHFQGMIHREFYDAFNKVYGEPDHIQVIENRQFVSESFIKDDNGKVTEHLRKNTFDVREGTFEEKPLWIIWEREHFQIKAFLRHKNNRSEMTFKKTN